MAKAKELTKAQVIAMVPELQLTNERLAKEVALLEGVMVLPSIQEQTIQLQKALAEQESQLAPIMAWFLAPGLMGLPNAVPVAAATLAVLKLARVF